MRLTTHFHTQTGDLVALEGESLEELQSQLAEDYDGPRLEVRDEPGFVRGWIGRGGYRYN